MAKIFVVDDSRVSRKMIRNILEENGYEVVGEAANGQEAVEQIENVDADVVTLDITMPVMDGIEALKKIREMKPDMKAVMVTAAGQNDKVMEAIKAGASDFVQKPFEEKLFIAAIQKAIS